MSDVEDESFDAWLTEHVRALDQEIVNILELREQSSEWWK